MASFKEKWVDIFVEAVAKAAESRSISIDNIASRVTTGTPPQPEMGDLSFPVFPFARDFKMAPPQIAELILASLPEDRRSCCLLAGPYLNIKYSRSEIVTEVIDQVLSEGINYGKTELLKDQKIMIEFSCPNTNKPLHLGHLRNNILGESLSRIFKFNSAEVQKVNLINNRGIHICKSMLAYQEFGEKTTPEKEGKKGDHLVGDFYVKYNDWVKEDEFAEIRARSMLQKWEADDPEVVALWKLMNQWTLDGINETYRRTGISFDKYYYESDTYLLGRDLILKGLEEGVFYKDEDGCIRIDLSEIKLDTKVLLRSDGTSVYMTQDVGTAVSRHKDYPFDRLIYVVGSEQAYHFQVLFFVLKKLGYEWADMLFHLSYGMVNLPEGKMKSREGTVVDADNLISDLTAMALEEIKEKGREEEVGNPEKTAEKVALAALHYFLLQVSPTKDMVFNPSESLSFNGNTGPYIQYMVARINSIKRKAATEGFDWESNQFDASVLSGDEEWELIKIVSSFSDTVLVAGKEMNPSHITEFVYQLAKQFSRFYRFCPVFMADKKSLSEGRLILCKMVLQVMEIAVGLINVPVMEKM